MEEATWERPDPTAKCFLCTTAPGPPWNLVYRRVTYDLETKEVIQDVLIDEITNKQRTGLLPNGHTNGDLRAQRRPWVTPETRSSPTEGEAPERHVTAKAKSTPVTAKEVLATHGKVREKWIARIEKELESFRSNHVIKEASQSLIAKCRQAGNYPLPCQMVYVLKPDLEKEPGPDGPAFKCKSRLVICGNRQPWEQSEETSTPHKPGIEPLGRDPSVWTLLASAFLSALVVVSFSHLNMVHFQPSPDQSTRIADGFVFGV
eukprot:814639-Amphidinium_carterae.1